MVTVSDDGGDGDRDLCDQFWPRGGASRAATSGAGADGGLHVRAAVHSIALPDDEFSGSVVRSLAHQLSRAKWGREISDGRSSASARDGER